MLLSIFDTILHGKTRISIWWKHNKYKEYLTDGALIIVDNIFVRGLVADDNVENKNKRKLRDKVRAFNQSMKDSEYTTSFLNVGDGLLVIY